VLRWWNHELSLEAVARDFGASVRGKEPGEDLVVLLDDAPVGLLQRSPIAAYPGDLREFSALVEVPGGAVELDYFLGAPELRGRGLGSRLIRTVVASTWTEYPDVPCVLVAVVAASPSSRRDAVTGHGGPAGLRAPGARPTPA